MSSARRSRLFLVVCLAVLPLACGDPPDREMQQAQGALDAARAAGAQRYATEEFAAAEEALNRSTEAAAQRDYRLALNHALDSRERAQNAAKMAADGKAAARVDADHAISRAAAALEDLHAKLAAAEGARTPARALAKPRRVAAELERLVQEARTAYDQGDYLTAASAASAIAEPIAAAANEVDAAAPPARRRKR